MAAEEKDASGVAGAPEGDEFYEWFNEMEGYGCRAERAMEDIFEGGSPRWDVVAKWIKAAFEAGRDSMKPVPGKWTCHQCGLKWTDDSEDGGTTMCDACWESWVGVNFKENLQRVFGEPE